MERQLLLDGAREGKDTLLQWFMGQVARATKGKADPGVARELLLKSLAERRK